mmetsp:Transcript_110352/g.219305  ORF Transcript_110352/g.219305 Transcript_110352/m.219305 type:complete len:202 (-) Transcript_110352:2798-3403(-)
MAWRPVSFNVLKCCEDIGPTASPSSTAKPSSIAGRRPRYAVSEWPPTRRLKASSTSARTMSSFASPSSSRTCFVKSAGVRFGSGGAAVMVTEVPLAVARAMAQEAKRRDLSGSEVRVAAASSRRQIATHLRIDCGFDRHWTSAATAGCAALASGNAKLSKSRLHPLSAGSNPAAHMAASSGFKLLPSAKRLLGCKDHGASG